MKKLTGVEALLESWRRQTRVYKGITMIMTAVVWTVWFDYVTAAHMQPRFDTLAQAKAAIIAYLTRS